METIGGYRLVRVLGSGMRADIWLGHSEPAPGAAIKLFHRGVSRESIDTEIEALGRASSRHLLQLEDLASTPDGTPVLVLQRLSGGSLARLLETVTAIPAGEAVTILAPVAQAVAELHRVGIAHGALRLDCVRFDETGAPVIACFGAARLIGPFPVPPDRSSLTPAELEREPSALEDLRCLAAIARSVLQYVDGAAPVLDWLDAREPLDSPSTFAAELGERMHSLADALPVHIDAPSAAIGGVVPHRVLAGLPIQRPAHADAPAGGAPADHAPDWLVALHLPDALTVPIASALARLVPAALRGVRRRVWVAAAAVALLIGAVAVSLIDPGDADVARVAARPPAPSAEPEVHSVTEPASADPVTAARNLLRLRAECIAQRSILCLDEVDQAGSAALDADQQLVRALQEGESIDAGFEPGHAEITLVQRFGDTALLVVRPEAGAAQAGPDETESNAQYSMLLMIDEAGWRIRDVAAGQAAPG